MDSEKHIRLSNKITFDGTTSGIIEMSKPDCFRKNYLSEWPVVYVITGEKEAYVGETVDAGMRMAQHYQNPERRKLKEVQFISDDTFNKSVILDLESFLISHMQADGTYLLQNGNLGQKHDYYQKEEYEKKFQEIWNELRKNQTARKTLKQIENSNIFKYSPYKSLTPDQYQIATNIIKQLALDIKNGKDSHFIVNGSAGTGKTILGIYLLKLLATKIDDESGLEDEDLIENLQKIYQTNPNPKIGIVVSMVNLRSILTNSFKHIHGLTPRMVYKPSTIATSKDKYDVLIVDEAHRLKRPRGLGADIGSVYKTNEKLGLDKKCGTQLDWLLQKGKHVIFFYDKTQSIKTSDIEAKRFENLARQSNCITYELKTQIRCANGGQEYIDYIHSLFSNNNTIIKTEFKKYDFKLFDNVRQMTNLIERYNEEYGLCRNLAGYAWDWKTKGKLHFVETESQVFETNIEKQNKKLTEQYINQGQYDIDINGEKYIWNSKYDGWIASKNSTNEIGCIHTIQGFDLNYAGVIIGNELRYDPVKQQIYIDQKSYKDKAGKKSTNEKDLLTYILNVYKVLCTRGIKGTYLYVCDENLHKYLEKYIKKYKA